MEDYIETFNTAFKAWLLNHGTSGAPLYFYVDGRKVINVYEGNFDSPKLQANMPLIEYQIVEIGNENMTSSTELINMKIDVNVWMAGKLNSNTTKQTRATCKAIARALKVSTAFDSYGIVSRDISCSIDGEPLYATNVVGSALSISLNGSNSLTE